MISPSSSIASSQPATSAKVVLGVSLFISLALDLANFMTPAPPPCMRVMMNKKMPMNSRNGTIEIKMLADGAARADLDVEALELLVLDRRSRRALHQLFALVPEPLGT